jgi:tRNA pseudouridine synthase 9
VLAEEVKVCHEDDRFVVISKPCSIPVHESGAYRYNTALYILANESRLKNLLPLHRLDRLTSGLVIFAKTKDAARLVNEAMEKDQAQKTYLARVMGDFPMNASEADAKSLGTHSSAGDGALPLLLQSKSTSPSSPYISWVDGGARVKCDVPLRVKNNKDGVHECHPEGKESSTIFRKLSFNGKSSLVECMPITGRTHQIRLHLQYLGFPIANDPNYGGELNYGFKQSLDTLRKEDGSAPSSKESIKVASISDSASVAVDGDIEEGAGVDPDEAELIKNCKFCQLSPEDGLESAFKEEQLKCTGMWLHALKYEINLPSETLTFEVPPPNWVDIHDM